MLLFADCPLCDGPAPVDLEIGAVDCPACAIRFDLADDPTLPELAAAA
jgi:hypothetical protein